MTALLLRAFSPLHLQSARLPRVVQAIIAPVQAAHLRALEASLAPRGQLTLDAALRSRLLPTERWSDTERWRGNLRLLAWLRSMHLRAQPSC